MIKKYTLKGRLLTTLMVLLAGSMSILAQNSTASSRSSSVSPLSDFLETYEQKHSVISKNIEEKTTLTFDEKLLLYQNEVTKLKEDFKAKRKAEYLSKTARRAKRLTCTGTHTRNSTICEPVYIKAPNSDMYTEKDWIKVEGSGNIETTIGSDSSISMSMKVNGKRTNKGVVYATFKYKPESIPAIIDQEIIELFSKMHK